MIPNSGMVVAMAIASGMAFSWPATSQDIQTSVIHEAYRFHEGSLSSRTTILETTIPVSLAVPLGPVGTLSMSSGYTRVYIDLTDSGTDRLVLSAPLDTEMRLAVPLVPGRLILLGTAAVPTGRQSTDPVEIPFLTLLANDIVGFAITNLGGGGYVGSGFVATAPLGRMTLAVAGSARRPFSYTPLRDDSVRVQPGAELRIRGAIEGAIGPRTFLRMAGMWSRRAHDEFGKVPMSRIGNRMTGFVSVDQGLGGPSIQFYALDVFRTDPEIAATAIGSAFVPRGNLFAAGMGLQVPVNARAAVNMTGEWRVGATAADSTGTELRVTGTSTRIGAEVKYRFGRSVALVATGSQIGGDLLLDGRSTEFVGYRGSVRIEVRP